MSKGTILVTGNIFVDEQALKTLETAGYKIHRHMNNLSSTDELIPLVKGKVAYFRGGFEKISDRVIEAADKLKIITFPGHGYQQYIIGYQKAFKKGIKITRAPHLNTLAVAEFAVAATLMMTRRLLEFGRMGDRKLETVPSLHELKHGIVGLGGIGGALLPMLKGFGVNDISYFSRTRKQDMESRHDLRYAPMEDLLQQSDIIYLCTPHEQEAPLLGAREIGLMKKGALLINPARPGLVDFEALRKAILAKKIRAAYDIPPAEKYDDLPVEDFFCCTSSAAFNTFSANRAIAVQAAQSMLNVLETGSDPYVVNP